MKVKLHNKRCNKWHWARQLPWFVHKIKWSPWGRGRAGAGHVFWHNNERKDHNDKSPEVLKVLIVVYKNWRTEHGILRTKKLYLHPVKRILFNFNCNHLCSNVFKDWVKLGKLLSKVFHAICCPFFNFDGNTNNFPRKISDLSNFFNIPDI